LLLDRRGVNAELGIDGANSVCLNLTPLLAILTASDISFWNDMEIARDLAITASCNGRYRKVEQHVSSNAN
jgi:hypothetical protein